MTAPPCKLAPRTQGSSTNHFIRAWTRTRLKKFTPIKYTPVFPSVDLRTGQTGNLSGSACGLWLSGSPDIRNCFHTPKKETGDETTNALNLVDVLSSKVVSSSLKKMLAVSGKVNITFVYISPSQNWLLPLAQSILPLKYKLQVQPHLPSCTRAFSFLSSGKTIRIDRRQNRYIRCWWTQTN